MNYSGFRRAVSLCILTLLCVLPLPGCEGGAGDVTTAQTEGTSAQTQPSEEPSTFTVASEGTVKCAIVRPVEATAAEIDAAVRIRQQLLSMFPGSNVTLRDDFSKDGKYDSDSPEILVGNTGYPETREVFSETGYGKAVVRISGAKLCVFSATDSGISFAAGKACEIFSSLLSSGSVVFGKNDEYSLEISKPLSTLPYFEGGLYSSVYCSGDKAYQVYVSGATPEMLDAYLSKLSAAGFEKTSDREIEKNRFCVLTGNGTAVTAYYTDTNRTVRIIAEPESNLYVSAEWDGNAVTTPILTMIGRRYAPGNRYLDTEAESGLMCFVLRLSDGRFVVVDGGVYDGTASYSQAIYAKMREQAPDPSKIVIAAWIITHSHNDHVGGFCSFAATYSKNVTLESFHANFPDETTFTSAGETTNDYKRTVSALKSYFPGTKVYKMHTGQQFRIADALFEVYYTHEDFVTRTRTVGTVTNNWNNSSLIFSVDIAGQRIMFTGDSQEIPNNLTASVFGSYLKSDILQVCHHGGVGGTNALYRAIDPEIALYTTSDALVGTYISKWSYNYYLVNELHVKEYFNSADRITTFALPYHAKSSGFIKSTVN